MSSSTRFFDVLRSSFARREREQLADLLLEVGPDAPTLCEGWKAHDLAVHLVVREYRPDAMAGGFISALEPHLKNVTARYERRSFSELVDQFRAGPPRWSVMRPLDGVINAAENFIHLEDVRRAGGGDQGPRPLSAADRRVLWFSVGNMAKVLLNAISSPVHLVWGSHRIELTGSSDVKGKALTISGDPQDIALWLFGRDEVAVPYLEISDSDRFKELQRRKL